MLGLILQALQLLVAAEQSGWQLLANLRRRSCKLTSDQLLRVPNTNSRNMLQQSRNQGRPPKKREGLAERERERMGDRERETSENEKLEQV